MALSKPNDILENKKLRLPKKNLLECPLPRKKRSVNISMISHVIIKQNINLTENP